MGIRETVLAADDLQRRKLTLPEWGVHVYVRAMTCAERDELAELTGPGSRHPVEAVVASRFVVDDGGKRIFTDDDQEALAGKSRQVLARVLEAVLDINGIADDEEAAADAALGKSATTRSGDSGTA